MPAAINKSGEDETHTLRKDIAALLGKAKVERQPKADDLVFPDMPTLDDLRDDLGAAGVKFDDGKGSRRLDFHAMRKTLVRMGKASGLSVDQVSLLLGHKDMRTTRKYYDDDLVKPMLSDSVEKLPTLGQLRIA